MMRRAWLTGLIFGGAVALFGCTPVGGDGSGGDEPAPPEEAEPPADLIEGLVRIEVRMQPAYDVVAGLPRDFFASGIYEEGESRDLTADVQWNSSDPAILSFNDPDNPGRAMVHAERQAPLVVTASLGDIAGELTIGDGCNYPAFTSNIVTGATMPALEWELARRPDGSRGKFSLRDVFCGESDDPTPSIYVFVMGAGWCGACTQRMAVMAQDAAALRDAGAQLVFVEVENGNYEPASTDEALQTLSGAAGQAPVFIVGDGDTGGVIGGSGAFTALPSVAVVRASDMKVIADDRTGAAGLDFFAVAADPNAGWENPPPPMIDLNCGPADEEELEPNNLPAEAPSIGAGIIEGGICDEHPDFFTVDIEGPWRATLEFSNAIGNLDLYGWDPEANAPLRANNRVIGSSTTGDEEVVEHAGVTVLRVGGFQFESTTYTLTVEAL